MFQNRQKQNCIWCKFYSYKYTYVHQFQLSSKYKLQELSNTIYDDILKKKSNYSVKKKSNVKLPAITLR